jgi:hypothetical protein
MSRERGDLTALDSRFPTGDEVLLRHTPTCRRTRPRSLITALPYSMLTPDRARPRHLPI